MDNLSEKKYWDAIYSSNKSHESNGVSTKLKAIFGETITRYLLESYREKLFWSLCKKYLPNIRGQKILEIGSAPGTVLVNFFERFGYCPFGVEYSRSGTEMNRKLFEKNNLDPNNVFCSDVFSPSFQSTYQNFFDIVYSGGFVEHFKNVREVAFAHSNLTKKGGYCIVSIPNVKGINYLLTCIFNKAMIPIHNLEIMDKDILKDAFEDAQLETVYSGYYGTFDFGLFNASKSTEHLLDFFYKFQALINLTFSTTLKEEGLESHYTSPFILYIGKKVGID